MRTLLYYNILNAVGHIPLADIVKRHEYITHEALDGGAVEVTYKVVDYVRGGLKTEKKLYHENPQVIINLIVEELEEQITDLQLQIKEVKSFKVPK